MIVAAASVNLVRMQGKVLSLLGMDCSNLWAWCENFSSVQALDIFLVRWNTGILMKQSRTHFNWAALNLTRCVGISERRTCLVLGITSSQVMFSYSKLVGLLCFSHISTQSSLNNGKSLNIFHSLACGKNTRGIGSVAYHIEMSKYSN